MHVRCIDCSLHLRRTAQHINMVTDLHASTGNRTRDPSFRTVKIDALDRGSTKVVDEIKNLFIV
jgi:hypothetical protein